MRKPVTPSSETRYRIGQVARELGVEPYVLRFWEEEFPLLKAARTAKGQRYYTEEHVLLLKKIRHLLYEEKMTIKGARQKLATMDATPDALEMIRTELEEIRRLLTQKP